MSELPDELAVALTPSAKLAIATDDIVQVEVDGVWYALVSDISVLTEGIYGPIAVDYRTMHTTTGRSVAVFKLDDDGMPVDWDQS